MRKLFLFSFLIVNILSFTNLSASCFFTDYTGYHKVIYTSRSEDDDMYTLDNDTRWSIDKGRRWEKKWKLAVGQLVEILQIPSDDPDYAMGRTYWMITYENGVKRQLAFIEKYPNHFYDGYFIDGKCSTHE